jgi:hypothetical protein
VSEERPPAADPPLTQILGAILWPSFFAAGVATMLLFAHFDPLDLRDLVLPQLDIDRGTAYTIGFFLLWACTAASSLFTWLLLRPPSRLNPPDGRL